MGRKLLIMPPYEPLVYRGRNDVEMRSAPYRSNGGYNDRAGVMNGGYYDMRGGDYGRMGGPRYYDEPYMGEYEPEMRRGRDSRGRYVRMGGYDEPWMDNYTNGRVRDEDANMRYPDRSRVHGGTFPEMKHKIGFSIGGEMERLPDEIETDYRTTADYQNMDEMTYRKGEKNMGGRASASGYVPFSKEMAIEWTRSMENDDGSKGPHWTMDQVKNVMAQHHIECDPYEFYAVLNMMFSDYSGVAKKMGVNNMDFYICMAKAFLDDPDVGEDKLARYYEYVVK